MIRVILLVAAAWGLIFGAFLVLARLKIIKSEKIIDLSASAFSYSLIAGFWVLVALAGWWLFFDRGEPETEASPPSAPAPSVSRGAAITSPEEAFEAFEASDNVTCRKAFPIPPDKAEDGRATLVCGRVFVGDSEHPWQITVWIWADPFFAEESYREQCEFYEEEKRVFSIPVRDWLIFERGHPWVAVFRDDDLDKISQPAGEPSRELALAVANALGSTPWKDCGAVR